MVSFIVLLLVEVLQCNIIIHAQPEILIVDGVARISMQNCLIKMFNRLVQIK